MGAGHQVLTTEEITIPEWKSEDIKVLDNADEGDAEFIGKLEKPQTRYLEAEVA